MWTPVKRRNPDDSKPRLRFAELRKTRKIPAHTWSKNGKLKEEKVKIQIRCSDALQFM